MKLAQLIPLALSMLALAASTRHPGVAIAISSLNFPDKKAIPAVRLCHLVIGAVVSVPYADWRRKVLVGTDR